MHPDVRECRTAAHADGHVGLGSPGEVMHGEDTAHFGGTTVTQATCIYARRIVRIIQSFRPSTANRLIVNVNMRRADEPTFFD